MARSRWLTLVALILGCVDGPTSPGRLGELRIRPTYLSGDAPAAVGVTVDSAHVRIVRAAAPDAPLVDTMVRYTSDTASLGWILNLLADEESLRVELAIWDDGVRVYAGDSAFVVRDGVTPAAEPVVVAYVGPPVVASVSAEPDAMTLEALGASATLSAEARDRHGQVVVTAFTWTSEDPAVATVDAVSGMVTAVGNGTTTVNATVGSLSDAITVHVAQRLTTVTLSPTSVTLDAIGATHALSAAASDANGHALADVTFAWTSSAPEVVSVDANGVVTSVTGGSATIRAASGDVSGTATVTVNPVADVVAIDVAPGGVTLTSAGATQQFTAQARDADGDVLLGVQFTWSSTAPGIATVDAGTGLATAAAHGQATIVASAGSVTGTAALGVDLTATVTAVVVSPASHSVSSAGATRQFTAEARDAAGTLMPVGNFAWASNAQHVATVDATTGLVTAIGHGDATITATVNGVTGSAGFSVDLTTSVTSVVVTPGTAELTVVGATRQFTAEARDAAGAIVPGVPIAWSSASPAVATIDAASGLATAVAYGTTSITASAAGVTGSAQLTVNLDEIIVSVVVTPAAATLETRGATQPFTAEARDGAGMVVPVAAFAWSSSATSVATVNPSTGLATATGHGTSTITATVGDASASATLSVNLEATIVSVAVTPEAAELTTVGATRQFIAEARDAAGAVVPGVPVTWTSSTTAVATIDASSGLATAAGHGSTTIVAHAGEVAGTATLAVNLGAIITSVIVTPASAELTTSGATHQFVAEARDITGAVVPVATFAWSSSAPTVATVNSSGLATATGHGGATITASVDDVSGDATVAVDFSTAVASVVVMPATAELTSVGATQPFTAEARDASDAVLPGLTFAWSSSVPDVATIDAASGLATATGHGVTTVTAAVNGVTGSATLTVDLVPTVASIVVSPASVTLTAIGATQPYAAEARDAQGAVLPGVPVSWSSSATDVASIDAALGVATSAGHGTATITATANDVSGSAALSVDLRALVTSVVVTPATATLTALGATQQFTAEARDASDAIVPGVSVTWSSSATAVATIDTETGLASAVSNGSATMTAAVGDVSGSAELTVAQQVVRVEVTPATATITGLLSTLQMVAQAYDANDQVVAGAIFTWSATPEFIAPVDANGLVTGKVVGTATIRATTAGVTGSATVHVVE